MPSKNLQKRLEKTRETTASSSRKDDDEKDGNVFNDHFLQTFPRVFEDVKVVDAARRSMVCATGRRYNNCFYTSKGFSN
jgi:hypothetical protein